MNGLLCIDKPAGPSSMAAIRRVKQTLGIDKIGHSGTLDPQASGLLVVATGTATRLFQYLNLEPKCYTFTIVFGTATDTLDAEGAVTEQGKPVPNAASVKKVLRHFTGEIEQIPPSYSAVKVQGVRAYALARQKKNVTLAARTVTITRLGMTEFDRFAGQAHMEMECSSGTYVRSLARDIAAKLRTAGYAQAIRRTKMGAFSLDDAVCCDASREEIEKSILPLYTVLSQHPSYIASRQQARELSHGKDIAADGNSQPRLFVFNNEKKLIAIARHVSAQMYHPVKVFEAA